MISLKNTLSAITSKISALNTLLNDVPHYTLLWTNPNPTSSFSAQTISLDLSKYDSVYVVSRASTSVNMVDSFFASPEKNQEQIWEVVDKNDDYIGARRLTMTNSGVTFSEGVSYALLSTKGGTDNTRCIPTKIYGIKFGGGYNLFKFFKFFSSRKDNKGLMPKGVFV